MSLAAFTMPLWALAGDALSAADRPELYLQLAATQVAILAAGITAGAQFGLVGVGLGWSAASACIVPIGLLTLRRGCPVPRRAANPAPPRLPRGGPPLPAGVPLGVP